MPFSVASWLCAPGFPEFALGKVMSERAGPLQQVKLYHHADRLSSATNRLFSRKNTGHAAIKTGAPRSCIRAQPPP